MSKTPRPFICLSALSVLVLLSGCASDLIMSSGPTPRVEDCMIVGQGTPAKFVCADGKDYFSADGKSYTSLQLADIRNGKAATK